MFGANVLIIGMLNPWGGRSTYVARPTTESAIHPSTNVPRHIRQTRVPHYIASTFRPIMKSLDNVRLLYLEGLTSCVASQPVQGKVR